MLNWHETPFVRLLVPLAAGILLSINFNYNHYFLQAITFLLLVLLVVIGKAKGWFKFRWLFGAVLSLLLTAIGFQVAWYYNELNAPDHFSKRDVPIESLLTGKINDAPVRKPEWIKLELKLQEIGGTPDSLLSCTGNVLLYIARDSASEGLKYGDVLAVQASISLVQAPENPNSFDYKRYLHFQNIHYQAFVRPDNWQLLLRKQGNSLYALAIDLQSYFLKTLRKHLTTENELAVGSALILGYRDEIPENIKLAYSQTGAMHVLAVSGLHVGIVFVLLNFFLKRVKTRNPYWVWMKMLIIMLSIWAFALITGASPSVIRAATMFSFVNVGQALRRRTNIYNTLSASAFFLLLYNPFWIASVSFQLSYLAVFGIVYFQPKIVKLIYIENWFLSKVWALICVSLGAQLMTLPLTLYYFNQFPVFFWLSSLFLVPAAGFVLGGGIFLLLLESTVPALAGIAGQCLWAMLWVCNKIVFVIQQLPGSIIEDIWISSGKTLLLYLAIGSVMIAWSFRKLKWAVTALSLLSLVSLFYAFRAIAQESNIQVVIYSIYKHTAIDFIDGKKVYSMYDSGLEERALSFAAEGHRQAMGIEKIHSVVLTDSTKFESECFITGSGFSQFYDARFAILEKPIKANTHIKPSIDYVLVRNSPRLSMEELVEAYDFKLVIFDASNKKWQIEKWKLACEQLDLHYYDINENGAWILNINQMKLD